jgi:hypothetical protein
MLIEIQAFRISQKYILYLNTIIFIHEFIRVISKQSRAESGQLTAAGAEFSIDLAKFIYSFTTAEVRSKTNETFM